MRDLCIGIFHSLESLEQGMVQTEGEGPSQEVILETKRSRVCWVLYILFSKLGKDKESNIL